MFEKATREKVRFASSAGLLSVEDLWDLPLTSARAASLDSVAKLVHKALKEADDVSFVEVRSTENTTLNLKMDIVKHIIAVRQAENAATATAAQNREKKRQILDLIATKQNEQLAGQSLEDLMKMAEAL